MPRTLLFVLLLALSGCHRYVPARMGAVPPGADVRVHLTSGGVQRIGEAYGSASGTVVGKLESWSSEVVISIPVEASPGMLDRGLTNRIVIPAADIVAVDLMESDRARTAVLSLGIGGVAGLTAIALFGGVFGGSTVNEGPAPEDTLLPLWMRIFP